MSNDPLNGVHPTEFLALQLAVVTSAVRALLASHPEPEKVRTLFDQIIGQLQASGAVAGKGEPQQLALRRSIGLVFPPHSPPAP